MEELVEGVICVCCICEENFVKFDVFVFKGWVYVFNGFFKVVSSFVEFYFDKFEFNVVVFKGYEYIFVVVVV